MKILATLLSLALLSGCGGHAVTQAPLEETRGLPITVYAGTWVSPGPTCITVSGDTNIHSRAFAAMFTDTYYQTTQTLYSDSSCQTSVITYKTTSTYSIGDVNPVGQGYEFDSITIAQVVNVNSAPVVAALNSQNASRSQCATTFAMGDTIVLGKDCKLDNETTPITTALAQQTYGLIYIDTTSSPNRMYMGTASAGHDGTTSNQRYVALSTAYSVKQ